MASCYYDLASWTYVCSSWSVYRVVVNLNQLKHFPYKHVLVLVLAKSGMAAARLLIEQRKHVRINDRHVPEDSVIKQLQSMGAELVFGSHPLSVLDGIEIIVKNPGIPY